MRKLLVIAVDQQRLGAAPGPHTFKPTHEELLRAVSGDTFEVVVATPEEAKEHYADAEIIATFPLRAPDISLLPKAKWLHSFSAGVDRILTPAVAASDIHLTNSSGVHATPIAEHIMATLLIFTRSFHKTFQRQQKHEWEKDQSLSELRGKNILIVGLGEIGKETARLTHAFGAHVHAVSRSGKDKPEFVERLEKSDQLDAMLPSADFVVITLPYTEETHHLFDKNKFALIKPSAIIINIGRGGIIKEADLIDALKKKIIAGAGLDVFEKEPLPAESELWDMEQVIITPHHSGLSHKYMDRAIEWLCKNLEAYLNGQVLPSEVDKKLGY